MDVAVLIVRWQHLSACGHMLPSGLKHLADGPACQFAAGTLVLFGMLAEGDRSSGEAIVNWHDRMHDRSVKVGSIVRWQDERWLLAIGP